MSGRDTSREIAEDGGVVTAPVSRPDGGVGIAAGASIGPFVVERELGRGGSGVVLAAFDPELERRVAIKLLHAERSGITPTRTARFLREAQALAKLSHPNVLTVYQVGSFGDQVFIAMELIPGATLREWLTAEPRPWRAIVHAFARAGQGLSAAHHAGLVHRDFKPDNVLRGDDGRILVTDFGLAGADYDAVDLAASPAPPVGRLTDTGLVMGTPRYMSPEQHAGGRVDARADQFAFCVALYEALFGVHPFDGAPPATMSEAIQAGKLRPLADRRHVPRRIVAAVHRGLSLDPTSRFATMDALLERLLPRRTRLGLVAAGLAAAAIGGGLWPAAAPPCGGAARKLMAVWNDGSRAAIRMGFAASGRPRAADATHRVTESIDRYADTWTRMRTEACEATAVRHEQSPALLDLRMACLDRRLGTLSALTRLLGGPPDPELVDRGAAAVRSLDTLDGCADTVALLGASSPRPEAAGRVAALEARLDDAQALALAGKSKAAVQRLVPLVDEARAVGHAPLLARAALQLGRVLAQLGEARLARPAVEEAVASAAEAKDDLTSARALLLLMHAIGVTESKPAEALALRAAAEGAVRRAGSPALLRADLHEALGQVLLVAGTFGPASQEMEAALALRQEALGPGALENAHTLSASARVLMQDGKYDAAQERLERSLAIAEKALGPDDPEVARIYSLLGHAAFLQHHVEAGLAHAQKALQIVRTSMGEDSPRTASALHDLANMLDEAGRTGEAVAIYEHVLEVNLRLLGPEHPEVAITHQNLGICLIRVGKLAEARPHLERAVAIREKAFGPEHPNVATSLGNLGQLLADLKDWEGATAALERAVAIRKKTLRPDHPDIARSLTALAVVDSERGRYGEAIPLLESALAIVGSRPEHEVQAAKTRLALARALADSGGDRRRVLRLANEAKATFVAHKLAESSAEAQGFIQAKAKAKAKR